MNDAGSLLGHLNGVDIAFVALLLVSLVVGLVRGLVYELLSLAGWVVAVIVARLAAPELAPRLPWGQPGSSFNQIAAMVLAFVLTLMAWGLLSWLLQKLIKASPLRPVDRALGGLFGLGRGLVVALVVALVVTLTPVRRTATWQASASARMMGLAVEALRPAMPGAVTRRLPGPDGT